MSQKQAILNGVSCSNTEMESVLFEYNADTFVWEWEIKKNDWVKYGSKENDDLNSAALTGQVDAEIENQGSKLKIDLIKMCQKNLTTGFERKVRCGIKSQETKGICAFYSYTDCRQERLTI